MKTKMIILGAVLIVETVLFELWIYITKPTPDVSIGIILIIPVLFGVSMLTGVAFYWLKLRHLAKIALLNSLAGPAIFYFLWGMWFDGWRERNYTEYSFSIDDTKLELMLSKTSNEFSISDVTNQSNGSTTGLFFGEYETRGDTIILIDGQTRIKIIDKQLFGFPQSSAGVELSNVTEQ